MTNPQVPEGARLTTPQAESSYQNGTGRSFSSDGVEALSRAAAEKAVAVTRAEAVKAAEGLVAFAENVAWDMNVTG